MPDYFFHVTIELFPRNQSTQSSATELSPPNLSHFFKALKPFARSTSRRHTRDHSFDRPKSSSQSSRISYDPPTIIAEVVPTARDDHRIDDIYLEGTDMTSIMDSTEATASGNIIDKGIGTAISGQYLKGRYQPITSQESEQGWGVVHLYRDADETPGLYRESPFRSTEFWSDSVPKAHPGKTHPPPRDDDCTTLCILAVPSYMTPSDFLAFVGEETRDEVSHFRMVRTSRANRYMVLMKFKHGKRAREWQHEWNGKIFNSMEPETCHVVFLKSVELIQNSSTNLHSPTEGTSYPKMTNDPFIPAPTTTKPLAPRTPSLVELPTCPVCLERMDETTGLLTIPCQHVFHCTCLQKWSGGGCPVCRYTHDDFSTRLGSHKYKSKHTGEFEISDQPLECEICHSDTSLWQCLICGKVGCGRYEGKHAYAHFEESGHTFSMDLDSKRVWDYTGDGYVHRIIQDAANPGEKLVELPGRRTEPTVLEGQEDIEMAKMENVALEYTHLLTSQLDSQRVYFEEIVERAVDKAADASKRADRLLEEHQQAIEKLKMLESEHDFVAKGQLPELEKEKSRLEKRASKFEDMAKGINQQYLEEKSMVRSLMERIEFLENSQIKDLKARIQHLEEENATKDLLMEGLREEHHDALMQLSAQKKLQEMIANGELEPEELEGATISAGPAKVRRGRGRGKATLPTRPAQLIQSPSKPEPVSAENGKSDVAQELYEGLSSSNLSRGQNWDSEKAKKILEEAQAKLLKEGLLQPSTTSAAADSEQEIVDENGNENDGSGKAKKRRKGKGKGKK